MYVIKIYIIFHYIISFHVCEFDTLTKRETVGQNMQCLTCEGEQEYLLNIQILFKCTFIIFRIFTKLQS